MENPSTTDHEQAVTSVLHAMADGLHESLCGCRAYPTGCKSSSVYDRDYCVATLTYAEAALEEALRQGWTPSEKS